MGFVDIVGAGDVMIGGAFLFALAAVVLVMVIPLLKRSAEAGAGGCGRTLLGLLLIVFFGACLAAAAFGWTV